MFYHQHCAEIVMHNAPIYACFHFAVHAFFANFACIRRKKAHPTSSTSTMLTFKNSTTQHQTSRQHPCLSRHCACLPSPYRLVGLALLAAMLSFSTNSAAQSAVVEHTDTIKGPAIVGTESPDSALMPPALPQITGATTPNDTANTNTQTDQKLTRGITYVGLPLVIAGILGKGERHRVYYLHKDFLPEFKSSVDDYVQFAPFALATGMNLMGVRGKSSTLRYLVSSAMSFAIMAASVNSIKYTANQMRPDNSTRNSFPSGHTATAFVAATILHKEYGLTVSPLYSIAGYGLATATGVMRMLNNRHWMSDVFCGAGIGIMSTELAYALSDLLFKKRGLLQPDKIGIVDLRARPSFFSIRVGGIAGQQKLRMPLSFKPVLGNNPLLMQFGTGAMVGIEAAYFFNPYVGIGTNWQLIGHHVKRLDKHFRQPDAAANLPENTIFNFPRTGINELSSASGLYLSLPFSSHLALGGKFTLGRNIIKGISVKATKAGTVKEGTPQSHTDTKKPYLAEWNFLSITGNKAFRVGTGLSLTAAYKQNYSWRAFVDLNYSHNTFTAKLDPAGWKRHEFTDNKDLPNEIISERIKKNMLQLSAGTAFSISF